LGPNSLCSVSAPLLRLSGHSAAHSKEHVAAVPTLRSTRHASAFLTSCVEVYSDHATTTGFAVGGASEPRGAAEACAHGRRARQGRRAAPQGGVGLAPHAAPHTRLTRHRHAAGGRHQGAMPRQPASNSLPFQGSSARARGVGQPQIGPTLECSRLNPISGFSLVFGC